MKQKVVILGAGFGGLELSTRLTQTMPEEVDVTLIDRNDYFIVGFAKLEVLFGRKTSTEIKSYYRNLSPAIHFHKEEIQSIDPSAKRVVTNAGEYDADILVIALGADLDVNATPGLSEHGTEFYSLAGVEHLSGVLRGFEAGTIVVGILGIPYKCPPAPFETALQLHDFFEARGLRTNVTIRVLSPTPTPLPVSREGSETILRLFSERNIEFLAGHQVTSLDEQQAIIKDKNPIPFDLFMGVPVHRVPRAVAACGLASEGWIAVNAQNLETKFSNVYAIGDVTKIPAGAGVMPKAGAFADRAADAVADEIAYRIRGTGSPAKFDGAGSCYLEFGRGAVAKIEANFLGGPAPSVKFVGPSPDFLPDKEKFASSRIQRWFSKA